MNTKNLIYLIASLLAGLSLEACGTFQVSLATPTPPAALTPGPTSAPTEPQTVPAGVLQARDAALAHLRSNADSPAPEAGLEWQAADVSPENMPGAGAHAFTASGWTVTVSYPIVAPDAVIYEVAVASEMGDFEWTCRVDARGQIIEPSPAAPVTGWLGHVTSLPAGSPYDDYLSLSPAGTGELGLSGANPEMEVEIVALRDKPEPGKYANFWGSLTCGVDDYNGCRLVVERVRYGSTATDPEPVSGWEGTLTSTTFNSGLSYVFILAGDFPVWHSIHSNDPQILDELETLRDTGAVVQVWGEFMTGVPDVNGTRIQADRVVVVQPGEGLQPATPAQVSSPPADWQTYTNPVYGYRFRYPPGARITEHGPVVFPNEDLPTGLTPDEYLAQLEAELSGQLCVEIQVQHGVVYIAAPPNQGKFYTPCGRTGVGAGELIDQTEWVVIDGQVIEASGFEFLLEGESLERLEEWFHAVLSDGTRIQYGSLPRADATYADYMETTREVLLQILMSYESSP